MEGPKPTAQGTANSVAQENTEMSDKELIDNAYVLFDNALFNISVGLKLLDEVRRRSEK